MKHVDYQYVSQRSTRSVQKWNALPAWIHKMRFVSTRFEKVLGGGDRLQHAAPLLPQEFFAAA